MTPNELKAARQTLGLSAEGFARAFGVASGRTVRGWEAGERNGKTAPVPESIALLVRLALEVPAARKWLLSAPRYPHETPERK